ncbi:asparagine synthase [Streptomyces sp. BE20]|uniref:asparagine synthase-related protein n=1 Tax=Streptomyces sp. BE20 TaxID=3002525 RepID=UPI002E79A18E|nr:asparagine synthase-related protein [Streptomyces sp. BE20]MEE1822848.1 asparagine synthase [Streptomyces sp. BE20]
MRWLTGWCTAAPRPGAPAHEPPGAVSPIAARLLWSGPDPLWAVGDWRPEEIRLVTLRPGAPATVTSGHAGPDRVEDTPATSRLAVLGHCGASDAELAAGLAAARGGAVRHLTVWPGSYTAVLRTGVRSTVLLTDLAGAQPVFHTPWAGGTAYATAALPLADLVGAPLDTGHLAARLACPESPEALGTGTPYLGVQRVPPGHALAVRGGRPYLTSYDEPGADGARPPGEAAAVRELTRALLESVRSRIRTSPAGTAPPAVGSGRSRLGVDLSYGTASATVALLAAAVPLASGPAAVPRRAGPQAAGADPVGGAVGDAVGDFADSGERAAATGRAGGRAAPGAVVGLAGRTGAVKGSWARPAARPLPATEQLAAVTFGETAFDGRGSGGDGSGEDDGPAALTLAPDVPRLRHTVLAPGPATLPYAHLRSDPAAGRLTDEPGPELVAAAGAEARFDVGGTDHLTGYGARQVLDGHPARLADLVRAGRSRELLSPVVALAGADRAAAGVLVGALRTPLAVVRAAHRLSRIRFADALDDVAVKLTLRHVADGGGTAGARSVGDLAWVVPGPAARWLSDEALSAVALRLRLAAREPAPGEHPGAHRARHALHRHARGFRTLVHATEQPGQRLHAPFLDNQVVRAARLLPADVRLQPGARPALLQAVLAGAGRTDLPPGWGRGPRPDRTTATRAGLRLAADGLAELFDAPLLAEAGLIDLRAVRADLARAADPATPLAPAALAGLADLVATELWLRRVRARRHGACWTGLPLPEHTALTPPRFA